MVSILLSFDDVAKPIFWKRTNPWNPFSTVEFFDHSTARIEGDRATELLQFLRENPNARRRGFWTALSPVRLSQVWVNPSTKRMAVTKGSAGLIMDIPNAGDVRSVVEQINNHWNLFDTSHRVGPLRLRTAQARQLEGVLEFVAQRRFPYWAAAATVVAGGALGFVLSKRHPREPRVAPASPALGPVTSDRRFGLPGDPATMPPVPPLPGTAPGPAGWSPWFPAAPSPGSTVSGPGVAVPGPLRGPPEVA